MRLSEWDSIKKAERTFFIGELLLILFCLMIIPGLDFLVWYLVHPAGFWQKIVTAGILFFMAAPRIGFDFFIFGIGTKIWLDVTKY